MLSYAQLSLRKVTRELDQNYARQEAWAEIAEKNHLVHLVISGGPHTFSLLLSQAQADEILTITNQILAAQEASLIDQELGWCREINLLHEQAEIGRKAVEQQRQASLTDAS